MNLKQVTLANKIIMQLGAYLFAERALATFVACRLPAVILKSQTQKAGTRPEPCALGPKDSLGFSSTCRRSM